MKLLLCLSTILNNKSRNPCFKSPFNILKPGSRSFVTVVLNALAQVKTTFSGECMWPLRDIDSHDDVIKWKHFPRHCPFVRGIHRWPVNSPHKGQWCRALMFSLICAWTNGWVNNRYAVDLKCHCANHGVTAMMQYTPRIIHMVYAL